MIDPGCFAIRRRPEYYDDWIDPSWVMTGFQWTIESGRTEDRLGRQLGPEFDCYCTSMDERMDHRLGLGAGNLNLMTTGFQWMIDWAIDSDPNSITTVFQDGS